MKPIDPELLRKFFDGKCSPEEVHQVLIWINSDEGVRALGEEFEKFEPLAEAINSQPLLAKIHEKIGQEEDKLRGSKEDNVRRIAQKAMPEGTWIKRWKRGIAASLLFTLMASAVWLILSRREGDQAETAPSAQIEYLTRQTRPGEKLTLKLNDGSIIHLNSNSKIRFPKFFTGELREVFMEGQAFFDVQRDENKPFIVHSKGLITRVIGTSFAILEDSAAQISQVAVLTGKVKVAKSAHTEQKPSEELYLEPMDAASLDAAQGSFEKIKVDYDNAFAWKDKVLVLQNATFEEVLRKLENWYGVSFIQKRNIKNLKDYTGRFDDQTLEEVMIGLSFTYDFGFDIQDSTIIIH
ncbi:FecR family protein [Algoriphagus resistens]|uniref:FecR family protein n=1 Tax=Algoriphagus resistens TaxID=1750590 RepID=UPI000716AA20|nr:FecR family protein [Algoriphagus resistens]